MKLAVPRPGRETRLLLLTLGVSVVMLLVLARFRFPEERGVPTLPERPPAAPLERLAARATYDELASIVGELERRIAPALVVLQLNPRGERGPLTADAPGAGPAGGTAPEFAPGVRIRPDAVVAMIEPGASVVGIVGSAAAPIVEAYDPLRALAIVKVPPIADAPPGIWERGPHDQLNGRYVAVVEGTMGGPTLRPTFLGRADPIRDFRWNGPLLVLGGALQAPSGSLVFSLDARLVGMSVLEEGSLAIVPAQALLDLVTAMSSAPPPPPGDIGVTVQALTPALAAATGASLGVVVAHVAAGRPADGLVRFGDVVESIDGERVTTPRAFAILVGRAPPGRTLTLRTVRDGEYADVEVTVVAAGPAGREDAADDLGLVLRTRAGEGAEVVEVAAGSAAARAGLTPGDVLTRFGDQARPTPAQIRRIYGRAAGGAWLLAGVTRDGRHLVLALGKP